MNVLQALLELRGFDHAVCNQRLREAGTLAETIRRAHGHIVQAVAPPSDTSILSETVIAGTIVVLSAALCIWSFRRLSEPHAPRLQFFDFRLIGTLAFLFSLVWLSEVGYEWLQYVDACHRVMSIR